MKNSELWSSYGFYTEDLTKHTRQLAFAGVAVSWFFRSPEGEFPGLILIALLAFVGFFALDVLQYCGAAILLRFWTQGQEAKMYGEIGTIDGEYPKPRWIDLPAFVLFNLKILSLMAGFSVLGVELLQRGPMQ